jgi:hypothetical protein
MSANGCRSSHDFTGAGLRHRSSRRCVGPERAVSVVKSEISHRFFKHCSDRAAVEGLPIIEPSREFGHRADSADISKKADQGKRSCGQTSRLVFVCKSRWIGT